MVISLLEGRAEELAPETGRIDALTLAFRADGRLTATRHGATRVVRLRQCFPWSEPARHLSLRDDDDGEFALVADPAELDAASRLALEQALVLAGFVLDIIRVHAIREEVEVWCWDVDTAQGPRRFQMRLDDWPRQIPGGGLLIRDVCGDLYRVADPHAMDAKSRKILWAFVD